MIGALAFIAMSWIFTIFWAWVSDSEPPNTVKSLANTKVLRPLTVPPAGDDAVARHLGLLHAEFGRAVLDEHVEFLETALVEQEFDALPRGQLAAGVLCLDALFATRPAARRRAALPGFSRMSFICSARHLANDLTGF